MRAGLLVFIFLPVLYFTGCAGKQQEKSDPMADFDTLYVKPGSSLVFQRYHTFMEKEADIYGHLPRTFSYNDTAQYEYAIDSGRLIYNKKYFTAACFFHQLKTDSSVNKSVSSLDMGIKPAMIEYRGNFYPGKRPTATCYLTLSDTSVLLNNAKNSIESSKDQIDHLATSAYIDGMKWKIFNHLLPGKTIKDSVRLDVRLAFTKQEKKTATMH